MRRRDFFPLVAASAAAAQTSPPAARKGRLKQCVTGGVFGRGMAFEDTCREAARLGIVGYDLQGPNNWPTLKKYGLLPTMYSGPGGTIPDSLNRKENHEKLEKSIHSAIDEAAANSVPNIITFSGNRRGMDDREVADTAVAWLNRTKAHAEEKGLNSYMDH